MTSKKVPHRITVSDQYREKYEEILRETGISSGSQLFAIFLVNYGDVLIKKLRGY